MYLGGIQLPIIGQQLQVCLVRDRILRQQHLSWRIGGLLLVAMSPMEVQCPTSQLTIRCLPALRASNVAAHTGGQIFSTTASGILKTTYKGVPVLTEP